MRAIGVGRLFFGLGFAVVGAIGLYAHEFVLNQQPVPQGVPWRTVLASLSGALLLATGAGLLAAPTARRSAIVLTVYLSLWVIVLQLPRVLADPLVEANWLGLGEDLTLAAAARFYSIAKVLFAPNIELCQLLESATGKIGRASCRERV